VLALFLRYFLLLRNGSAYLDQFFSEDVALLLEFVVLFVTQLVSIFLVPADIFVEFFQAKVVHLVKVV